jgi:hypothetical protein
MRNYKHAAFWGNAYLQDEYSKAEAGINNLRSKISKTIQAEFTAASLGSGYGSSQEFTQEDLRENHYMFGMPYFEDSY